MILAILHRRRATVARLASACVLIAGLGLISLPGTAAVIHLYPGGSFESAAESLNPGDTLIVHAGTYAESGRVAITVRGTQAQPVVIQAAAGEARPLITRSGGAVENTIDIVGATWLTIRGLEITGGVGDGVNMSGNPSYITLEDLEIHDILVGINFRSSMHHITARRNQIYNTADTGEGMYVGCHDGSCAVSESLIEGNWIHHTANSDQGDGIEIKKGSHSNVIRDNVIHDTFYPCIILYGTQGNPPNIVERNVMWNCADAGIQVAADAVVRNNIIIPGDGGGLSSQSSNGVSPANLSIVNNTFIGGSPCLRMNGWAGRPGMVFANNAVYCPTAEFVIGSLSGVTVTGNVVDQVPSGFPAGSYTTGRSQAQDFLNPAARNFYPTATAPLLGAGNAVQQPVDDFNGTPRQGTADAGAYLRTTAGNPGWAVGPGFKGEAAAPAAPAVSLVASPASVAWQGSAQLNWSTTGAQSCTAQGGWSGSRNLSGSQSTGALAASTSYTLICTNATGQTGSASATVQVAAPPPVPTLTFSAASGTVTSGGSTVLTWATTGATSCMASGGWSGSKPTAGTATAGPLAAATTYTQTCSGPGGNVVRSVTVSVTAAPVVPGPPPPVAGPDEGGSEQPVADAGAGGSSAMDPSVVVLSLLAAWRRRKGAVSA
ncbi:MAG: right-handed parallel beta-helix repeat-containing protein [Chromatiales bacterium]|nr:right-handed parallel beta-helix repeat-containing protein [Chromatiales bacterium]